MTPMHVAFFGHNVNDAAVRRRAVAFRAAGFDLTGFMPRRGAAGAVAWENVDLGKTFDNAYLHRIRAIVTGARTAARHAAALRSADVLYARNLDMLACAVLVRHRLGLSTPLIYECLDVHRAMTGPGPVGVALRAVERRLLGACALVAVSSPSYETEYFARRHPGVCRFFLIENRLIEGDAFPARPVMPPAAPAGAPLRLGWFGNLRCARSLALLKRLATHFGPGLRIVLRGYPARGVFPDFEADIAGFPTMTYGGRYRAPEDLATLYASVDLVWAGDYHEAGANSLWLLPNRLYEGGYFATPAIAPAQTATGRWIAARAAGFTVAEPVESSLTALVGRLIADRAPIARRRARLLAMPRDTFVEEPQTVRAMVAAALRHDPHPTAADTRPRPSRGRTC